MPAPTNQADKSKFRWKRIDTSSISRQSSPGDGLSGGGTDPDFTMRPTTVSKMPTTGLLLMLKQTGTAAVPDAGGFEITVWLRDPATGRWAAFDTVTIDYDELFVSYDIDASEIWFQIGAIDTDGTIDFGIAEQ